MNHITRPLSDAFKEIDRYDTNTALTLAEHSVAAYLNGYEYRKAVMNMGYKGGVILEEGNAEVAIAWGEEGFVITPRGSEEWKDWKDNFRSIFKRRWLPVLPYEYDNKSVKIGAGFKRPANLLCRKIANFIIRFSKEAPYGKIAVTGHSRGAALVPLIISHLKSLDICVTVAYSFESPRVGNKGFAKWYADTFDRYSYDQKPGSYYSDFTFSNTEETPTYNVTNLYEGVPDIVSRFPRRYMGFRHVGRRVLLGESTMFGNFVWQDFRNMNPIPWWMLFTRTVMGIKAHRGEFLLTKLRNNLVREGRFSYS